MKIFALILMAIGMGATLFFLGLGLFAMTRGGEFNQKWSNKLMRYRIVAQAFSIAMFMLGLHLMSQSG